MGWRVKNFRQGRELMWADFLDQEACGEEMEGRVFSAWGLVSVRLECRTGAYKSSGIDFGDP